jgi:ligand-binding SRPBCC domain-containing protein
MNPEPKVGRNGSRMVIHTIQRTNLVPAPLAECWSFFSNPRNLERITPPSLDIQVTSEVPDEMYPGLLIEYRVLPLLGFRMTWLTEITHVERQVRFVDEQRVGPYKLWHHEHRFRALDQSRTEMQDTVHYVLPFSPVSEVFHGILVVKQLRRIFDYREQVIGGLFRQ